MTAAKILKLRLFLEGIEAPVIGAQVNVAPNSPMMAAIQVPPLPEGTKLKPRTLVHLYFLDFWAEASPMSYKRGSSIDPADRGNAGVYDFSLSRYKNGELDEQARKDVEADINNYRYKLLFGGEVVGFQWTKGVIGRQLVLQCQDWSSYWDAAVQFKNTDLFGPGAKALFSGGGTTMLTDFLSSKTEVVMGLLRSKSISYPGLEGLLAGIVRLLEGIGGAYYRDGSKNYAGQNIFFSLAELRLHITQMITAWEHDPSVKRLMGGGGFGGMSRVLGGLGEQVSFRGAINALLKVIFHSVRPQPCPKYIPGLEGSIDGFARTPLEDDPKLSFIPRNVSSILDALEEVIDALEEAQTDTDPSTEPTPTDTGEDFLTGQPINRTASDTASQKDAIIERLGTAKKQCTETSAQANSSGFRKAGPYFQRAKRHLTRAADDVKKKWKGDNIAAATTRVKSEVELAKAELNRIRNLSHTTTSRRNAQPARLNQQVFAPDTWFSAPPRCNVIFPEQYHNISYARSFMQEPTRLMLKTNDEFFGEDELFDCFYFAPKLEGLKKQKAKLQAMLQGDIMEHELYTGIVPVFEKMGEFNIFGVRQLKGKSKGRRVKVGLAQRSTNFLFFRYRFGARNMQINGVFNPYIACGFPGFIIDKYVDLNRLEKMRNMMVYAGYKYRPLTDLLGAHFLANFTQVSHNVNQKTGGSTSISAQYCREHNEKVEFLGTATSNREVEKRFGNDAARATDIAAVDPPPKFSLGINYGVIYDITKVTDSYGKGMTLPFFGGPRREGTGELVLKVPVGVTKKAKEFGPEVSKHVGDPEREVTFEAYRLSESIPRYRKEKVLLPAEELIRPGWYGDCWSNTQIGEVYDFFFGTGAITDPQQVSDPAGVSTGQVTDDAEDALRTSADGVDFDDPRTEAPAIISLEEESSIEQACTFLLLTYAYVRMNNLNTDEFIRAYTWRPIATMVDMFGSNDLELSEDGSKVIKGVEGFHSRAFGPYNDLFGLVTPEIEQVVGVRRGSHMARRGDTRQAKRDAVLDFVEALLSSRAVLG